MTSALTCSASPWCCGSFSPAPSRLPTAAPPTPPAQWYHHSHSQHSLPAFSSPVLSVQAMHGERPDLAMCKGLSQQGRDLLAACWDANPAVRPPFAAIVGVLQSLVAAASAAPADTDSVGLATPLHLPTLPPPPSPPSPPLPPPPPPPAPAAAAAAGFVPVPWQDSARRSDRSGAAAYGRLANVPPPARRSLVFDLTVACVCSRRPMGLCRGRRGMGLAGQAC
jgi:hypothetical protein